jgi:hypothetical protein
VTRAAFQFGDALNNESNRCTAPLRWYVPLAVIHGVYVLLFLGATLSVRGIHFMFNEYRDQKRTAAAMIVFIGESGVCKFTTDVSSPVGKLQPTSWGGEGSGEGTGWVRVGEGDELGLIGG